MSERAFETNDEREIELRMSGLRRERERKLYRREMSWGLPPFVAVMT